MRLSRLAANEFSGSPRTSVKQTLVMDTKVIPGEECVSQHKLLVCDLKLKYEKPRPPVFVSKRRTWKLREPATQAAYRDSTSKLFTDGILAKDDTEEIWSDIKESLLQATDDVCGWTKKTRMRVSWWWDDSVSKAVADKRRLWKAWKNGGRKEEYLE